MASFFIRKSNTRYDCHSIVVTGDSPFPQRNFQKLGYTIRRGARVFHHGLNMTNLTLAGLNNSKGKKLAALLDKLNGGVNPITENQIHVLMAHIPHLTRGG